MRRKFTAPQTKIIAASAPRNALSIFLIALLMWLAAPRSAQAYPRQYLSAGEITALGVTTASLGALGQLVKRSSRTKKPHWSQPLPLERRLVSLLGGSYHLNKSNFLDNRRGSLATPVVAFSSLLMADFTWPQNRPGQDAAEDAFLFTSGYIATKGMTDLAKGLFARQRPSPFLEPGTAFQRDHIDENYDNQSFFSGHTSGAFFSSAFLNLRLRTIMRQRLSESDYRSWRWAPPTLLFSWATFVGWSRIHAYKHYPSDVIVAAVAGTLMAKLFYSLADNAANNASATFARPAPAPTYLRVRIRF